MEAIGQFLGTILGPIGQIFEYAFRLPVYNVLMLLYQAVNAVFPAGAFAIAIILLTLLIRACLIPLTRKQLASTRKMQMLQPQLKELQARYRNDPQTLMREQQALYKENGVSMYGGCLPLLVQMPFLYALYYSFFGVLRTSDLTVINKDIYPFLPHLSSLPQMGFFWTSLATPDPWRILPIVAGVLTFLQLRMAMPVKKPTPPGQNPDATSQATQMTMYIMPFVTIFIGWTFPAGLALYWTISTGFSAAQQYFINGRNWGSLFVGIPGMEHLVPPPKDLTPTVTRPATPASGSARSAIPTQEAPPTGGLRGMWKQLRESAVAAQTVAAEEVAKREQAREAERASQSNVNGANGKNGTAATANRRQRPSKQGPVLVKPASAPSPDGGASNSLDAAITEAAQPGEPPERAIARSASGASNGNGTKPTNQPRRPSVNGGARPNTSGGPNAGQRRGGAKGASGSRQRGGRPKGSR